MSEFIMNMETQKLELHFEKADYMALSGELKKEIKSNFLFSRKAGAWISRAKFPNLSENARDKAVALQKNINDMRGDIAFFTQQSINSSSGRAFTNRRNRMFAAWERGFDEFKKSEYYAERAEAARQTAAETKPTDKGFIIRRIKEAEKTIRAQKKILNHIVKHWNRLSREKHSSVIMVRL